MQLAAALDAYVVQLQADGRAASTIAQACEHVRLLERWLCDRSLPLLVAGITHEHLAQFLASPAVQRRKDGGPRKPTSANVLRSKLRSFFSYLADAGYVDRNPARLIRRARCGTPPPRALPAQALRKLMGSYGKKSDWRVRRDHALVLLMQKAGTRIEESVSLQIEDVDLDHGVARLRRTKGGRERMVFLPSAAKKGLRAVIAGRRTGPVFEGAPGRAMSTRQARERLREAADRAGIEQRVTPHMIRHAMALDLYRRTGDLLLVQQALGHRAIQSTVVYAHADAARLRRALTS